MSTKSKLSMPEWIKEGYDSEEEYEKTKGIKKEKKKDAKTFKIRECPKCGSDNVNVILTGEEGRGTGEWECKKCKWQGVNILEKELTEEEFMKLMEARE